MHAVIFARSEGLKACTSTLQKHPYFCRVSEGPDVMRASFFFFVVVFACSPRGSLVHAGRRFLDCALSGCVIAHFLRSCTWLGTGNDRKRERVETKMGRRTARHADCGHRGKRKKNMSGEVKPLPPRRRSERGGVHNGADMALLSFRRR